MRQKIRNQFSFVCIFFSTWQKLVNFFTSIKPEESRSVNYNSMYLILACVESFAATVTLNILCFPVKWWNWWLPVSVYSFNFITSVLWRCWLGGRKGIRPVKNEWWGVGVVVCMEQGADLHMAQLMPLPLTVSCSSKIQIGFTFLVPAYPGCPGKESVKWL